MILIGKQIIPLKIKILKILLDIDYNIKWEQVSCLKGIRLEDFTPELESKAYEELKNNKH
jgi:hypothetical protein